MRESDTRRLLAQLAQRKHAESALWALVGLPRMEQVEYLLSVLMDVHYVGHYGVTRPHVGAAWDETGRRAQVLSPDTPGMSRFAAVHPHAVSAPPRHDARALALYRSVLKDCDQIASRAHGKLDEIVGESAA